MNKNIRLIFCMLVFACSQKIVSMEQENGKKGKTDLTQVINHWKDPIRINLAVMNPRPSSKGYVKSYSVGWNLPYGQHILQVLVPALLPGSRENIRTTLRHEYLATNKSRTADNRYFCLQLENLRRPLESKHIVIVKEWDSESQKGSITVSHKDSAEQYTQDCDIEPDKQLTEIEIALEQSACHLWKDNPEKNIYPHAIASITTKITSID